MKPADLLRRLDFSPVLVAGSGAYADASSATDQNKGASIFASPAVRDGLCIALVWAASAFISLFVEPNYEGASAYQLLYFAVYNVWIGWFVGFYLVDRVAEDGVTLFGTRSCAAILLGTLLNESIVEPYVFATGPINSEGVYYGLVDALTTVSVFVVLRLGRRLHGLSRQTKAGAGPGDASEAEAVAPKLADAGADRLFVRVGSETRRIFASDVIYMEAERDFTRIVCVNGEHFVSESLKSLLERSGKFGLVRVHKSFAANVSRVDRATRSEARLGAFQVPVGRRYWPGFASVWKASALARQQTEPGSEATPPV